MINIVKILALIAIFSTIIIGIYEAIPPDHSNTTEVLRDGTVVHKETIDGHLYLRTEKFLIHSESCTNH